MEKEVSECSFPHGSRRPAELWWKNAERVVVLNQPEDELFLVVRALYSSRRLSDRLNRRQKEADERADDRYHDK